MTFKLGQMYVVNKTKFTVRYINHGDAWLAARDKAESLGEFYEGRPLLTGEAFLKVTSKGLTKDGRKAKRLKA